MLCFEVGELDIDNSCHCESGERLKETTSNSERFWTDATGPYSRPWPTRLRFKLVCILLAQLAGVFLPLAFQFVRDGLLANYNLSNSLTGIFQYSLAWVLVAGVLSIVMLQQLVRYPGSWDTAYIFPSLLLGYGVVIAAMFVLRTDYSRYVILASFAAAAFWLYFDQFWNARVYRQTFGIVPGGTQRGLTELRHVDWKELQSPKDDVSAVQGVVADLHHDFSPDWERFIAQAVLSGLPVFDAKHFSEMQRGEVEFEHLSENTFGTVLPSKLYLRAKRLIDFLVALVVSPLAFAVIAIAAVVVKIESPGSVFYTQTRCGYRGQPFTLYKLRSMVQGADSGPLFTAKDDMRITRVGTFIRKYRIDELPQIINILKGEMSWIGPRPEALELADWYAAEIPYYMYRHAVPPGITGWAQVQQGNVAEVEAANQKLKFDFFYIKYFSLWLDVLISLKTVKTILTGFGAR
jgi:lipopolysaccharide/colanic/teichoic acid biosynthesis glycosyltransferase